jgi:hypothetical protein
MTACVQEVSKDSADFNDRSKMRTRALARALAKAATATVSHDQPTEGDAA